MVLLMVAGFRGSLWAMGVHRSHSRVGIMRTDWRKGANLGLLMDTLGCAMNGNWRSELTTTFL